MTAPVVRLSRVERMLNAFTYVSRRAVRLDDATDEYLRVIKAGLVEARAEAIEEAARVVESDETAQVWWGKGRHALAGRLRALGAVEPVPLRAAVPAFFMEPCRHLVTVEELDAYQGRGRCPRCSRPVQAATAVSMVAR